jgi:hypothetical protein
LDFNLGIAPSMNADRKIIRIGGASGFWGDSAVAAPQLARAGVDFLVFDYLAELTMSILAGARAKDPNAGYATDFVSVAMKSVLREVASGSLRVVSNAGGLNPRACASALEALCAAEGVSLKIAVVEGDDALPKISQWREEARQDMFSKASFPEKVVSANAYLGALPVKAALDAGGQVVITGRCVDSAVTLGVLMHAFDWRTDELDKLAQGALAGHLIECGAQGTGGLFTDWGRVSDWANIGYPILECEADGSFVLTKPAGTGGLVEPAVLAEQLLYEIGDPQAYVLPDVVCDFSEVKFKQDGEHRVRASGAKGVGVPTNYKVSLTYEDGFRLTAMLIITGIDAAKKAQATGEAVLARTRAIFKRLKWADYTETLIEVLGAETQYGPHARTAHTREAVLRLSARHTDAKALGVFAREIAPAGTSWSAGTSGVGGGRVRPVPNIRLFSLLAPKSAFAPTVRIDEKSLEITIPAGEAWESGISKAMPSKPLMAGHLQGGSAGNSAGNTRAEAKPGPTVRVPLIKLAWARSGDKGNISNIGVIARKPQYLPLLTEQLTPEAVRAYLAHLVKGDVVRYALPGIDAFNFVLHEALGGGGMASLRVDPLGKGMAQMLLELSIEIPVTWGLHE